MHKLIAAGLALTVALTPAGAVSTQEPAGSDPNLDKKICKKGDEVTGSRLQGRQVCKTRRQWNALEDKTRNGTHKSLDRMTSEKPGSL